MKILRRTAIMTFAIMSCLPTLGVESNPMLKSLKGDIDAIAERVVRTNTQRSLRMQAPQSGDMSTYAYTWDIINHENGCTWYYTQTFEERGWYLGASDIVIYDNNFEQVASIRVEIPEDMNVNDVMPVDFATTQFFDTDASTVEIPVFVHAVDNGTQINKVYVYNLEGEKVQEYDSRSMIKFTASDDYTRVILVNEDNGRMDISLLKPAEDDELPTVEHTFTIDQDLLYYSNGPALNYYSLNGEPFYCVSHFEKPCMDGFDIETYVPIQAPDNFLLIKTYNSNYEMVDSLRISIDPTNSEATYGFASLGLLSSKDVRLGDFTNDNQRNYIVTHYDYFAQSDDFIYYFYVYDQEGNLVNTIAENTTTWFPVSDIEGYEEQMVFLKTNESGEQILEMVNLPSCNVASVFPAVVDGYQISTTLDRYLVDDDYQYVISLGQADENENGDAMARIGWYNRDASVNRYVTFNIGKNAEGFTPYIASYVLNPYIFNTDDKREYFYLAMNKRDDGSEILDKTLYLADEEGNVLRTIKPDDGTEVEFSSGDIFDYNTDSPAMLLSFYNGDKDAFEIQFYRLPFEKFTSGGDGAEQNPYLITTPGELAQMHSEPAAHYVLGNDIDMSDYIFPYFAAKEFTGTFDGDNHVISSLKLDENGLFATAKDATIENVKIQSPILNTSAASCGIVVNRAINTTIENVHVDDAVIKCNVNEDEFAGGIVGIAENSTIGAVSLTDALVNDAVNFGGIVGNLNGGSVTAAVASGELSGNFKSGGIASFVSFDSRVTNSHTQWSVLLPVQFGGIAAHSIGYIANCYTTGMYYGELDEFTYPDLDYGGIAYKLDSNPDVNDVNMVATIQNCVALSNNIVYLTGEGDYLLRNNYSINQTSDDDASVYGAYKKEEEMDRTFFEGLGYAYGLTVDMPWKGSGMPVLYFENDSQGVVGVETDNGTIRYDGVSIYAADAVAVSLYNMQGQLAGMVSNTATYDVSHMASGIYVVLATDAQGNISTRKIVVK